MSTIGKAKVLERNNYAFLTEIEYRADETF